MKIPFHRRILPWLFALIFIFMAPTVVFYTAGYRWNQNKGVIERNGTLIFDTVPRGATISLNGQKLAPTTPYTMQNVAPGTYDISLTLAGYHPWSKTLPVEPERVTFATEVYLWPDEQPTMSKPGSFSSIMSDPKGSYLVLTTNPTDGKVTYDLLDANSLVVKTQTTVAANFVPSFADWDAASDGVLFYGYASSVKQTWFTQLKSLSPNLMPTGIYHWNGSEMVGFADNQKLTVKTDGSVEHLPQDKSVHDYLNGFYLRNTSGTDNLVLTIGEKTDKGFVLPPGDWQFRAQPNSTLLLQSGKDWLWVDVSANPIAVNRLTADWLWPITIKRQTRFLALNDNEIYVWENGHEPELVYRQSDPLVAAAWHPDGKDVVVATDKELLVFNLDARNGRVKTVLADFDRIHGATVANDTVFVIADKNGQSGIWRLPLAKQEPIIPAFGNF